MRPTDHTHRSSLLLLTVGGVIGVLLGITSALHEADVARVTTVPDDTIALINGKPIRAEEYASALALLAGDKRNALTAKDKAHVLTRLIEEELLVQDGIASGMVETNRTVRSVMIQALMDSIVAESASEFPTEEELQTFYEQHRSLFAPQSPANKQAHQTTAEISAFDQVREQVVAAYLQQARDTALRDYFAWLRAEAKIVLAPEMVLLPVPPSPGMSQ